MMQMQKTMLKICKFKWSKVSNVILVYKDGLKEYKSKQFPLSLQIEAQFTTDNPTQQNHKQNSTNLNIKKLV
jgi:hypothetical protein